MPVFGLRNPFSSDEVYPAICNAAADLIDVPDDMLLGTVIDQSPVDDSPRNMILEVGPVALILQLDSGNQQFAAQTRKSLNKTAAALQRDVLFACLPAELLDQIRAN